MPKTYKKTLDGIEYEIREIIPYKLMDDLAAEAQSLNNYPVPEPVELPNMDTLTDEDLNEYEKKLTRRNKILSLREKKTVQLKTSILKKMVIKPTINDAFLEEAGKELWDFGLDLLQIMMKAFEERENNNKNDLPDPLSDDLKKKHMT